MKGAAQDRLWALLGAALLALQSALLVLALWRQLRRKGVGKKTVRERVFAHSMAWAAVPALLLPAAAGVWLMRGAHRVNVLRAKRDLPAFKFIEEGDVEESRSPSPPTGAVRSRVGALGSVTTSPLRRGALITEMMLLKERPAGGQAWLLLAVPSSTSPPVPGGRVTLLGLKAGAEKPTTLGYDCLAVGAAGEKVVVALSPDTMSEAAAFLQPNCCLLAVSNLPTPARPPAARPCS